MKPYIIALAVTGVILFHVGLLFLYCWLVMVAPILALALIVFVAGVWMILAAAYLSK